MDTITNWLQWMEEGIRKYDARITVTVDGCSSYLLADIRGRVRGWASVTTRTFVNTLDGWDGETLTFSANIRKPGIELKREEK